MKKILILALLVSTSGCSTIVSSNNQTVTVKAMHENREVEGSKCTLTNSKGQWTTVTPQSVNIRKSFGDLTVECRKSQAFGSKMVKSSAEGSTFGNIIVGSVGALVDAGTGNGYSYPDSIVVDMMGNIASEM
jgi:uncharacterized protein YceK